jgi:diaminopimelate decarboxylase
VIAGNAGILVTQVIYIKEGAGKNFVIVDAAMNDLIRPSLYEAYHHIIPVAHDDTRALQEVDVVGPVCETGDTFAVSRTLPELRSGELVALRSCGAYGAVMGSTYNARPLAPEVMVSGDKWEVVRPRLSYDEMMAGQVVPKWVA